MNFLCKFSVPILFLIFFSVNVSADQHTHLITVLLRYEDGLFDIGERTIMLKEAPVDGGREVSRCVLTGGLCTMIVPEGGPWVFHFEGLSHDEEQEPLSDSGLNGLSVYVQRDAKLQFGRDRNNKVFWDVSPLNESVPVRPDYSIHVHPHPVSSPQIDFRTITPTTTLSESSVSTSTSTPYPLIPTATPFDVDVIEDNNANGQRAYIVLIVLMLFVLLIIVAAILIQRRRNLH